jgi:hypothetical protein
MSSDFNSLQSKAAESTLYNYFLHYVKFSNLKTYINLQIVCKYLWEILAVLKAESG